MSQRRRAQSQREGCACKRGAQRLARPSEFSLQGFKENSERVDQNGSKTRHHAEKRSNGYAPAGVTELRLSGHFREESGHQKSIFRANCVNRAEPAERMRPKFGDARSATGSPKLG